MPWDTPAGPEVVERTRRALEGRGFRVLVVPDGAAAREAVLRLLPDKAQVFNATSTTIDQIGLTKEILEGGRVESLRKSVGTLGPEERREAARRHFNVPDWVTGSVHAVTEDGSVLVASQSGSQLGAYATGAHHVVWVVGTHKIVRDLDAGFRRIQERSLPLEDQRALAAYGKGSGINKVLIVHREAREGRITIVLVNEPLGF